MAVRTQSPSPAPTGVVREPTSVSPAREGLPLGPGGVGLAIPLVDTLARLLEAARAARGRARDEAAGRLHVALAHAPSGEEERRALADFLLEALASGALGTLRDGQGRSSRAVAAATLLDLGYPYALELAPEDLEHLRAEARSPTRRRATALALAGVGTGTVLGLWSAQAGHGGWVLLQALLAAMSVEAYASASPPGGRRLPGRALAAGAAVLGGVGALFDPGLGVPLLGPVSVALLLDRQP